MDVAGKRNVGDSATLLYINVALIRLAKFAVIARRHLTGLFWCGFVFDFPHL